jgi:tetratricopeptide (TPR) repeat protein
MRLAALIIGAVFCAAALPASAQISVIGGGLARDCFEAAKFQRLSAGDGEKLCTRAIEQEAMKLSNRTATYTNRGVLRMRQGRLDASLSDFDVAKRMDPSIGSVYLNEGAALILKGDYPAALTTLNKAIELNSAELHAAHYNRAIAKERTGDVKGAYFDLQKSLELYPDWDLAKKQLTRFTVVRN